jgi:uncharacterized surface protein with fasciclin (FAS1) repeats
MLRINIYKALFASVLAGTLLAGCKKWDTHNAVTDENLKQTLFEQINADTSLSTFTRLLLKTGYDQVIASSKTFTVFAPTNTALASLDAAIINDSAKLRSFVGNHIATQSYLTTSASSSIRIAMLNGKYHNMLNSTVEDAGITGADKTAKNGVLHVINKMLPVLNNCWETMVNNSAVPAGQKNYMLSLFAKVFDTSHAVQTGVDANTGQPVYQPGTDSIVTNLYWRSVYDLRDESKQYTFFVLVDTAWNAEATKYSPYFQNTDPLITANMAQWYVAKDFAIEGLYTPATLPDTLISKFNVKVPVDKSAIVQTITTSNGIVYIMKKVSVQPKEKLKQFIIQAENYRKTSVDKRGNTYFRDRYNPLTGLDFKDILVYGHGVATFNINYRIFNVYSMKYKVYWVALNDFNFTSPYFSQKLSIGDSTFANFNYTQVSPNVYSEVYLGEYTNPGYLDFLDLWLVAANNTTAATDPIVCDYIRLEPEF